MGGGNPGKGGRRERWNENYLLYVMVERHNCNSSIELTSKISHTKISESIQIYNLKTYLRLKKYAPEQKVDTCFTLDKYKF